MAEYISRSQGGRLSNSVLFLGQKMQPSTRSTLLLPLKGMRVALLSRSIRSDSFLNYRTALSLETKWGDLQTQVSKFAACFIQVSTNPPSGTTLDDLIKVLQYYGDVCRAGLFVIRWPWSFTLPSSTANLFRILGPGKSWKTLRNFVALQVKREAALLSSSSPWRSRWIPPLHPPLWVPQVQLIPKRRTANCFWKKTSLEWKRWFSWSVWVYVFLKIHAGVETHGYQKGQKAASPGRRTRCAQPWAEQNCWISRQNCGCAHFEGSHCSLCIRFLELNLVCF